MDHTKKIENTHYEAIIVGGGASGLFCALSLTATSDLKESGDTRGKKDCGNKEEDGVTVKPLSKVLILEKKETCGNKLLISGLSQCNITQDRDISEFFDKYGEVKHGRFLRPALMNFTNRDLIKFFNNSGLETVVEKNSKVFPASKSSADVLDVLLSHCRKGGVEILCKRPVLGVEIADDESRFRVKTASEIYTCDNLVLALGGMTYASTGSSGDGYGLAKSLGHTIVTPETALCAVTISDYKLASLSGISFDNAKVSIFRDGKKLHEVIGDLLFTHTGLSGPAILHATRYIHKGDTLEVSFLPPGMTNDNFRTLFTDAVTKQDGGCGTTQVKSVLSKICEGLPKRFISEIFFEAEIPEDTVCAELSKERRNKIITAVAAHKFIVENKGAPNTAMVTCGGVTLTEVTGKTLESKVCPNLYIIGELLDIDGDTGGYNLQAAFSMGYSAAMKIRKNESTK